MRADKPFQVTVIVPDELDEPRRHVAAFEPQLQRMCGGLEVYRVLRDCERATDKATGVDKSTGRTESAAKSESERLDEGKSQPIVTSGRIVAFKEGCKSYDSLLERIALAAAHSDFEDWIAIEPRSALAVRQPEQNAFSHGGRRGGP